MIFPRDMSAGAALLNRKPPALDGGNRRSRRLGNVRQATKKRNNARCGIVVHKSHLYEYRTEIKPHNTISVIANDFTTLYDLRMGKRPVKKTPIQLWLEVGLTKHGKTNSELAKVLGIPQPRVSEMRKGKRSAKSTELRKISEYLEEPIPPELLPEGATMIKIQVASLISAGKIASNGNIDEPKGETLQAGLDPRGEWLALIVEGDSMDRISPPGSIIILDQRDKLLAHNGLYVIVDSEGNGTYKRFRQNPDRFEPVSTNTSHETIFPNTEMMVVGRVRRSVYEV